MDLKQTGEKVINLFEEYNWDNFVIYPGNEKVVRKCLEYSKDTENNKFAFNHQETESLSFLMAPDTDRSHRYFRPGLKFSNFPVSSANRMAYEACLRFAEDYRSVQAPAIYSENPEHRLHRNRCVPFQA